MCNPCCALETIAPSDIYSVIEITIDICQWNFILCCGNNSSKIPTKFHSAYNGTSVYRLQLSTTITLSFSPSTLVLFFAFIFLLLFFSYQWFEEEKDVYEECEVFCSVIFFSPVFENLFIIEVGYRPNKFDKCCILYVL